MKVLKGYVKNVVQSKGGMAIGYAIEKTLGFCIEYIQRSQSMKRRVWDDKEEPTMHDEILEGNGCLHRYSVNMQSWAHTFVLHNAATIEPWHK
jgi:hypothetical protein